MKKILILFVAVAAMLFTACEPKQPEEPAITLQGSKLAPSSVTLEEGESVKLHVKYTPDSAKATAPKVLWYSDKQRVASVDEEGLVTADRPGTAVITATCGKFEAKCTVNVSKKDLPGPDPSVSFSVSPKNIEAPAEGGTYEIVVKSNTEWTAETEATWASLNTTSGSGDATLTLTVEGTEDETPISQNITFTAGKGKYFVLVSRAGYKKVAQLKLDKTEADVAVSGGSVTVNVESEAEWTVACNDPHVSVSKSGNSATITVEKFNLSEENLQELYGWKYMSGNIFYNRKDERGLPIPVLFSNGDNSVTCMVYQKYPYIGVSVYGTGDNVFTGWKKAEAHDFTLQIEANIPWAITFEWDANYSNWATVNQSSGSGNATVTLHFNENTSGSTQFGYCFVNSAGGYTPFLAAYVQGVPNLMHGIDK